MKHKKKTTAHTIKKRIRDNNPVYLKQVIRRLRKQLLSRPKYTKKERRETYQHGWFDGREELTELIHKSESYRRWNFPFFCSSKGSRYSSPSELARFISVKPFPDRLRKKRKK